MKTEYAEYKTNNLGNISVDNEVIKSIALKAAMDIKGFHKIREGLIRKIWHSLTKKDRAQGVKLEFTNSSEVRITLKLTIEYGVNIPNAAVTVQENVKKTVEYMTGLVVIEVALKIIEIQIPKDTSLKEESEKKIDKLYVMNDES